MICLIFDACDLGFTISLQKLIAERLLTYFARRNSFTNWVILEMKPIEILKDLFFIERGYLNANHFVFRSKKPVLIDTAYIADFDDTRKLIQALGVKLSEINLIISTHSHSDHIGGNKLIQDESGCEIAIHKIGKHFIDTRDDWATWWRYYGHEAEFFTATRALDDGDTIAVGPHEFRIVYTPGHASDGIVLYNRKEKIFDFFGYAVGK